MALVNLNHGSVPGLNDSTPTPDLGDFGRDPFYASVFPLFYALSASTVLAYLLLIMLLVAPRSFLDGGGVVTLGRHSFSNNTANGITIGGRPWLQKVASLFVAIALTIASHDTFRVTSDQYFYENFDVRKLQQEVLNGTQIQIIQLISEFFLWLAQAQTLIRLFPRQREKIIIKWAAFTLITLNLIFSALDSFKYNGLSSARPTQFTEAIPALSYLFELSLGLLYAAWVLYYALTKKRYAFYHPLMKNIPLMATLSVVSVLVPVVFFILDIASPGIAVWGDFVRWVGAGAASVVVWEWVERIEALEREERKDGVLGREVFDGDDLIEASPSDLLRSRRRKNRKDEEHNNGSNDSGGGGGDGDDGDVGTTSLPAGGNRSWPSMSSVARRYKPKLTSNPTHGQENNILGRGAAVATSTARFLRPPLWPARPPPAVTPISRTDTASADSTIYAVRYQPLTETTSGTTEERQRPPSPVNTRLSSPVREVMEPEDTEDAVNTAVPPQNAPAVAARDAVIPYSSQQGYFSRLNPFNRKKEGPPLEVLKHTVQVSKGQSDRETLPRWDIKGRMEDFAATQAERILQQMRPTPSTENLSVMRIPAPPRRGAALARLLEEEAQEAVQITTDPPITPSLPTSPACGAIDSTSIIFAGTPTAPRRAQGRRATIAQETQTLYSQSFNEATPRRPAYRGDSSGSARSSSGHQGERDFSGRRPVDDILRDERQSPPPPRP